MPDDLLPAELALDAEPFDDAELDAALDHVPTDEPMGEPTEVEQDAHDLRTWQPSDTGSAEWAMRKLADVEQTIAGVAVQAHEWHRRIDEWAAAETKRLEQRSLFFQGALLNYTRARCEADPKAGTLTLPSGRVKVTRRQRRVSVESRELVAKSAETNLAARDLAECVNTPPAPAPVAVAKEVAKRAKIVEQCVRRCVRLVLEGDVASEVIMLADEDVPAVGDVWTYDDGIDERDLPIVSADVIGEELEAVAVWADTGQPIEGAVVVPARIDFTVET